MAPRYAAKLLPWIVASIILLAVYTREMRWFFPVETLQIQASRATNDRRMMSVVEQPKTSFPAVRLNTQIKYSYTPDSDPRPRNLHLVFMGDGVTRSQYIALAYFLKTGQWLANDVKPSPLTIYEFGGWSHFYRGSNSLLQPEEQCDCFTPIEGNVVGHSENRYFSDPERGNYIAYIEKFSFNRMRGHWRPEAVFDETAKKVNILNAIQPNMIPYEWDWESWGDTVTHHIAKLNPKPDFLVFDAGMHAHHWDKVQSLFDILRAAGSSGIRPIYKTTTFPKAATRSAIAGQKLHDNQLCGSNTPYCLNMSWTSDLERSTHYADNHYFKPDVNKRMNLQLLEYLQVISRGGNIPRVFSGTETS